MRNIINLLAFAFGLAIMVILLSCGSGDSRDPDGLGLTTPNTTTKDIADNLGTSTGPQDPAGLGCSVTRLDDGALITCGDGTAAMVFDGQDAAECHGKGKKKNK